jgi:hypothetical protein
MRNSERPSAGVPRDLPLDGLSLADLALLGEGGINPKKERTMDPKMRDALASTLAAVGMWLTMYGYTDSATFAQWSGAIMMVAALVSPWIMPAPKA